MIFRPGNRTTICLVLSLSLTVILGLPIFGAVRELEPLPIKDLVRIYEAAPEKPAVAPRAPHKLLVFSLCEGYTHSSIPWGQHAFRILGQKTGAYEPVFSNNMNAFLPETLNRFDAVLFNNTTRLAFEDPVHREALMEFVKGGKGVIGIHAATDNFYDWPEAAEMMGGLFDGHPWNGHGTWAFKLDDPNHPINRGFAKRGFFLSDEIYQLKAPYSRENLRVLVSLDMANPRNGSVEGIKRQDGDFAVSWVREFGKGRVFYCSLGHNKEVFWNPFVLTHYLDGIQYALGDLEAEAAPLPAPDRESVLAPGMPAGASEDPFVAIIDHRYGYDRKALAEIENRVRKADSREYREIESRLLEALTAPQATYECKEFVCRMLRQVGSTQCLPVLKELLFDPALSHMARLALQGIESDEVDRVLRQALTEVDDTLAPGIISTLATRRDSRAVPTLQKLAGDDNKAIARSALLALGRIGGKGAVKALERARVASDLQSTRAQAALLCAESFLAEGKKRTALRVYTGVLARADEAPIRIAASRGIAFADEERAVPTTLELLRSEDRAVRLAGAQLVAELPGESVAPSLAEELSSLSPDSQVALISALAVRGDRRVAPQIARTAGSDEMPVRIAAAQSLAVLGSPEHVELLATVAAEGGAVGDAAADSLRLLKGKDVDEAVLECLNTSTSDEVRVALVRTLVAREYSDGVPELLKLAEDENKDVRRESLKALAGLASEEDLPEMLHLLVTAPGSREREEATRSVVAVAQRITEEARRADAVLSALSQVDEPVARCSLLEVLGKLGVASGLPPLRAALKDEDPAVRKEAIRALSEWPTPDPLEDLWGVAENASGNSHRVLAVRGIANLLALDSEIAADEKALLYRDAMALADRPDEKRMLLAGLGRVGHRKALQLAQSFLQDPELAEEAATAVEGIRAAMKRPAAVTASHSPLEAWRAMDGDVDSRWGTAKPMQPGMWFLIDMGYTRPIQSVVLDCRGAQNDYPRGYEVYLSNSKDDFGEPVIRGKGDSPMMEIELGGRQGRYIKIAQTGEHGSNWWSIYELEVKIGEDE